MFIFYDTETSGLDRNFSQILQIGMIFTDGELNTLSSKKLECRCSPWVVPTPGALLTTGFVPDDLKFNAYSHFEMMREIDKWIRSQHWPLTFAGYNSAAYDEPILAQNLYQNLMEPRLTSSGNASNNQTNGQLDVMMMVKAVMMYMPGLLKLNTKTSAGNSSLRLTEVARQNGVGLSDTEAHDAMNDIKATVGVAKLIKKGAPALWQQMLDLSTVKGIQDFIDGHELFTCVSTHYGKTTACVVTALPHNHRQKAQALYNLDFDPTPYLNMTAAQLKALLLADAKQKPFTLVDKPSPILMPIEMSDAVLPAHYNEKLCQERAQKIKSHPSFLANLDKAVELATRSPLVPTPSLPEFSIDQDIPPALQAQIGQWAQDFKNASNWDEAARLLKEFYARFRDDLAADPALSRFAKLAGRIIYENAPQKLSAEKREAMKRHIASRILNADMNAPYMTVPKARKELEQIEQERKNGKNWKNVTDSQIRMLKLYYTALQKEYEPYLVKPPVNDNAPAAQDKDKKAMPPPAPGL